MEFGILGGFSWARGVLACCFLFCGLVLVFCLLRVEVVDFGDLVVLWFC